MTRARAVKAAMDRLRKHSESRAVYDAHGKLQYEGTPEPVVVESEIQRAFDEGRKFEAGRISTKNQQARALARKVRG